MKLNPVQRLQLPSLSCSCLAALLLVSARESPASDIATPGYDTSYQSITEIGANLSGALEVKRRQQIQRQPVRLGQGTAPCIASNPGNRKRRRLPNGADLAGLRRIHQPASHAKAMEESEKGFLKKYAAAVAQESGAKPLAPLPSTAGHNPWDSRHAQLSGRQLQPDGRVTHRGATGAPLPRPLQKILGPIGRPAGPAAPINAVITEKEWREAVMKGAKNALDCGYGVEGLKCVFECFGAMPIRPPWAAYFIHPEGRCQQDQPRFDTAREGFLPRRQIGTTRRRAVETNPKAAR
jgi:hypothetical protein